MDMSFYRSLLLVMAGAALATAESPKVRSFEKLPIVFEPNQGQVDGQVKFLARGAGYTLYLTDREAVMSLKGAAPVRMSLVGGASPKAFQPSEPTGGISNYFLGNDPAKWRTGIPNFRRLKFSEVYPGVDLVYYGDGGKLEYDLVVAPGADANRIEVAYQGVESLRVDKQGDLLLKTAAGELRQQRPKVYQEQGGKKIEVAAAYRLLGAKKVAFELARYDRSKALVIDPVLLYSTYLGGTNTDFGYGIAVDATGNTYVTGTTSSTDFPLTNAIQSGSDNIYGNAFVTKINASGATKIYSTYLGGNGFDQGLGIAAGANGNAYITGWTASTNFPTASPLQANNAGGNDAFVTVLNPSGSTMIYSTYVGGAGNDLAAGIAVDVNGNAYITGQTGSSDFPATNPFQSFAGGTYDAFVMEINPTGSARIYSSFLGGTGEDYGAAIAIDSGGAAYVTGFTTSTDFPTTNPLQAAHGGPASGYDAFVTKIASGGASKVYSTYLGGNGNDYGYSIAVDSSGNAYVAGQTVSSNFPTTNPLQAAFGGGSSDAFVTEINAAGSAKVYSTYLGGSGLDSASGIAVDTAGNAYITGWTNSLNFPTADPLQATFAGGAFDAFLTEIAAGGATKVFSTYYGGSALDQANGITLGGGNIYIVGTSTSTDYPTVNALQPTNNGGGGDVFITSIVNPTIAPMGVNPPSGSGLTQTFSFTFTDPKGFSDLYVLDVLISTFLDGQTACYFALAPTGATTGYLYLVDDAGDGGYTVGSPMALPSSNSVQNNQCTLNGVGSSISASGNTLTLTLAVTFNSAWVGNKAIYMAARSNTQNSGWQAIGTWDVPGTVAPGPAVGTVSPARSTSSGQTYTFTYTDTSGYGDLFVLDILTNSFLDGVAGCYIAYVPTTPTNGYVYLVDDAGDGGYAPGSPVGLSSGSVLQNSQCAINTATSSASESGNTLTLNLNLTFKTTFAGNRVFFLAARNNTTGNSGWQAAGSVTVP
jgi:Beta-propeller repeat